MIDIPKANVQSDVLRLDDTVDKARALHRQVSLFQQYREMRFSKQNLLFINMAVYTHTPKKMQFLTCHNRNTV